MVLVSVGNQFSTELSFVMLSKYKYPNQVKLIEATLNRDLLIILEP